MPWEIQGEKVEDTRILLCWVPGNPYNNSSCCNYPSWSNTTLYSPSFPCRRNLWLDVSQCESLNRKSFMIYWVYLIIFILLCDCEMIILCCAKHGTNIFSFNIYNNSRHRFSYLYFIDEGNRVQENEGMYRSNWDCLLAVVFFTVITPNCFISLPPWKFLYSPIRQKLGATTFHQRNL